MLYSAKDILFRERGGAEKLFQIKILLGENLPQLRPEHLRTDQIAQADTTAADFVFVGRTDTPAGSAYLAQPEELSRARSIAL